MNIDFILDMIPGIKKKNNIKNKCGNCMYYKKHSIKYGVCENSKSNKFIKFVYHQESKAIIQVPKLGICKFYKKI